MIPSLGYITPIMKTILLISVYVRLIWKKHHCFTFHFFKSKLWFTELHRLITQHCNPYETLCSPRTIRDPPTYIKYSFYVDNLDYYTWQACHFQGEKVPPAEVKYFPLKNFETLDLDASLISLYLFIV